MNWCWSSSATRLLAVLCITARCVAAQGQSGDEAGKTGIAEQIRAQLKRLNATIGDSQKVDTQRDTLNAIAELIISVERLEPKTQLPRDCSYLRGKQPSGVYQLQPSLDSTRPSISAYCDMDTDGGGWTVIQRRNDTGPHVDFFRYWNEYVAGFGDVTVGGEYWLGLESIHQLTSACRLQFELRIDMETFPCKNTFVIRMLF